MNIILGVEGTIIDRNIPRSYLGHFLLYCFREFETVSLWTSSTRECAYNVANNLQPILQLISNTLQKPCSFYRVFFNTHCIYRNNIVIKSFATIGASPLNTILIDTTVSCFADNPLNGIYIPTFSSNSHYDDIFLLILEHYLSHICGRFKVFRNINIEEGHTWYEDIGRITLAQQNVKPMDETIPMDLSD